MRDHIEQFDGLWSAYFSENFLHSGNIIFAKKTFQGQLLRVSFIEVLNLITIVILLYNSILSHALTHRWRCYSIFAQKTITVESVRIKF